MFPLKLRQTLLGNEFVIQVGVSFTGCHYYRDQWYKLTMEATVNYTRKKKQANKLVRSKKKDIIIVNT